MEIVWRKSAITSLLELDRWRNSIELPPIAKYLKDSIQFYFEKQDFSIYIPGRHVLIHKMPVDLRVVLVSIGKTDPYKVFYRVAFKSNSNLLNPPSASKSTNIIKQLAR